MAAQALDFDTLLDGVQATLSQAQRRLDERQARRLVPYFFRDPDGEIQPHSVRISAAIPDGLPQETIDVPLHDLCNMRLLAPLQLSIEFDCILEPLTGDPLRLMFTLKTWKARKRSGIDKLRIEFQGGDRVTGNVYLNDELFKEIPDQAEDTEV